MARYVYPPASSSKSSPSSTLSALELLFVLSVPASVWCRPRTSQLTPHKGIFMGYAHHDRTLTPPLWAFGHGLSYTSFALSALSASPVLAWQTTVTFSITNTGTTAGAHAPQIYVAPRKGTTSSAGLLQEQRLQAFAKVHLQPGEKKEVRVKLGKEAWSAYDQVRGMWVVSEGEYAVRLAYSSVDVAEEVVVRLEEGFTWTGL